MMNQTENPVKNLISGFAGLTNSQRVVAEYIIDNPFSVAFMTLDQFASKINVSTATIMRVMYNLNYSGYSEFQRILQSQLRDQMSPSVRLEANLSSDCVAGKDIWEKCWDKQLENIHDTYASISQETLDRAVELIVNARSVYFIAARGGMMVATYLYDFMNRIFGKCRLFHADLITEWCTIIPDVNEADVVIAISYPRYAKHIAHFLRLSMDRGARNILLTDSLVSPLIGYADILLPCNCSSLGFHNSPIATMMVADCLINVISIQYAEQVRDRLNLASQIMVDDGYYIV